jgi:hypothetical protein
VAGADPEVQQRVFESWDLREALMQLRNVRIREDRDQYNFDKLCYLIAGGDKPKMSALLKAQVGS